MNPQWGIPCLSPAPHSGYKPPGCFGFLFELSHMGREFPGKSFYRQTHLGCHIIHHLRASRGVWAALGILRAKALPGDQEILMGFTSTMGQVLGGGFWLWRGSRECWRAVGQVLLQGAALGISRDSALLQLLFP